MDFTVNLEIFDQYPNLTIGVITATAMNNSETSPEITGKLRQAEEEEDPPLPGEIVCRDAEGILCRKLNWREGDRTKGTRGTRNTAIVIEGFPPFSKEELNQSLHALSTLVQQTAMLTRM